MKRATKVPAPIVAWNRPGKEPAHHSSRAGNLRAAVFGVNDGLVSNTALVLGVAASGVEPRTLIVAGVAGLLAGSFSMATGEYVSVSSQRDLLRREVERERHEHIHAPEEEMAELAAIYVKKGLSESEARTVSRRIMKDPEIALDTHVREEMGLDPDNLGSPIGAAVSSFFTFAIGAIVPIIPFLLGAGISAVVASCVLSGVALASVGAAVGYLSGTGALMGAGRMLLFGAVSASATVAIGRLFRVAVAT